MKIEHENDNYCFMDLRKDKSEMDVRPPEAERGPH